MAKRKRATKAGRAAARRRRPKPTVITQTPTISCRICCNHFSIQWVGPNPSHMHCPFCATPFQQLPEVQLQRFEQEEPPEPEPSPRVESVKDAPRKAGTRKGT